MIMPQFYALEQNGMHASNRFNNFASLHQGLVAPVGSVNTRQNYPVQSQPRLGLSPLAARGSLTLPHGSPRDVDFRYEVSQESGARIRPSTAPKLKSQNNFVQAEGQPPLPPTAMFRSPPNVVVPREHLPLGGFPPSYFNPTSGFSASEPPQSFLPVVVPAPGQWVSENSRRSIPLRQLRPRPDQYATAGAEPRLNITGASGCNVPSNSRFTYNFVGQQSPVRPALPFPHPVPRQVGVSPLLQATHLNLAETHSGGFEPGPGGTRPHVNLQTENVVPILPVALPANSPIQHIAPIHSSSEVAHQKFLTIKQVNPDAVRASIDEEEKAKGPIGFLPDGMPLPCAFMKLPWPSGRPFVRLLPSKEVAHVSMPGRQFRLFVKRMITEEISQQPNSYLIRYCHPGISADFRSPMAPEQTYTRLFPFFAGRKIFGGSRAYAMGMEFYAPAVISKSTCEARVLQYLSDTKENLTAVYIRLSLDALPLQFEDFERNWSREIIPSIREILLRDCMPPTKRSGNTHRSPGSSPRRTRGLNHFVVVYDARFVQHGASSGSATAAQAWSPNRMRQVVHLIAQTVSLVAGSLPLQFCPPPVASSASTPSTACSEFHSSFRPSSSIQSFQIIFLPPDGFTRAIDTARLQALVKLKESASPESPRDPQLPGAPICGPSPGWGRGGRSDEGTGKARDKVYMEERRARSQKEVFGEAPWTNSACMSSGSDDLGSYELKFKPTRNRMATSVETRTPAADNWMCSRDKSPPPDNRREGKPSNISQPNFPMGLGLGLSHCLMRHAESTSEVSPVQTKKRTSRSVTSRTNKRADESLASSPSSPRRLLVVGPDVLHRPEPDKSSARNRNRTRSSVTTEATAPKVMRSTGIQVSLNDSGSRTSRRAAESEVVASVSGMIVGSPCPIPSTQVRPSPPSSRRHEFQSDASPRQSIPEQRDPASEKRVAGVGSAGQMTRSGSVRSGIGSGGSVSERVLLESFMNNVLRRLEDMDTRLAELSRQRSSISDRMGRKNIEDNLSKIIGIRSPVHITASTEIRDRNPDSASVTGSNARIPIPPHRQIPKRSFLSNCCAADVNTHSPAIVDAISNVSPFPVASNETSSSSGVVPSGGLSVQIPSAHNRPKISTSNEDLDGCEVAERGQTSLRKRLSSPRTSKSPPENFSGDLDTASRKINLKSAKERKPVKKNAKRKLKEKEEVRERDKTRSSKLPNDRIITKNKNDDDITPVEVHETSKIAMGRPVDSAAGMRSAQLIPSAITDEAEFELTSEEEAMMNAQISSGGNRRYGDDVSSSDYYEEEPSSHDTRGQADQ